MNSLNTRPGVWKFKSHRVACHSPRHVTVHLHLHPRLWVELGL